MSSQLKAFLAATSDAECEKTLQAILDFIEEECIDEIKDADDDDAFAPAVIKALSKGGKAGCLAVRVFDLVTDDAGMELRNIVSKSHPSNDFLKGSKAVFDTLLAKVRALKAGDDDDYGDALCSCLKTLCGEQAQAAGFAFGQETTVGADHLQLTLAVTDHFKAAMAGSKDSYILGAPCKEVAAASLLTAVAEGHSTSEAEVMPRADLLALIINLRRDVDTDTTLYSEAFQPIFSSPSPLLEALRCCTGRINQMKWTSPTIFGVGGSPTTSGLLPGAIRLCDTSKESFDSDLLNVAVSFIARHGGSNAEVCGALGAKTPFFDYINGALKYTAADSDNISTMTTHDNSIGTNPFSGMLQLISTMAHAGLPPARDQVRGAIAKAGILDSMMVA